MYPRLMLKTIKKKLKWWLTKLSGAQKHLRKTVRCQAVWYGNEYGGFYVCPAALPAQSIVYSFGVGEDISFDRAMMEKHTCEVFAFDPTPKSIQWVKQQSLPACFHFFGFGISDRNGTALFYLPQNEAYVSGSLLPHKKVDAHQTVKVPMRSFADIVQELGHTRIDVLKMDIEGAEYEVLESILT